MYHYNVASDHRGKPFDVTDSHSVQPACRTAATDDATELLSGAGKVSTNTSL